MPIARHPKDLFDYVLRADRELPEDDLHRTTFRLRPLSRIERMKMRDRIEAVAPTSGEAEEVRLKANAGTLREHALLAGLVGWDRLHDADGKAYPFETDEKPLIIFGRSDLRVKGELLDLLSEEDCDEIFEAILSENELTVEQGNG